MRLLAQGRLTAKLVRLVGIASIAHRMVELAAYAVGERHLERCLSESQIQNLQNKAAEGTMHIELEQLRKVHQFQASDADINQFIQNVKQLEQTMKQRGSTYKATGTFETATGTTTIEAKKSCYVATAVFETPFHPNVILLQSFRDLHLTRFWLGKRFIAFYYKIGPFLAGSVLARGLFKKMTRGFLNGVCNIIRRAMN